MNRKRIWEAGAAVTLLGALLAVGFWWFRRHSLNEKLVQAVWDNRDGDVRSLLRQGADPNHRDPKYRRPMTDYAARSSGATLKALLQGGANPNEKNPEGEVPLVNAAGYGYLDIVQILLRFGADVNATASDGRTALIAAVGPGDSPAIVRELLRAGADPNLRMGDGTSPVRMARVRLSKAGENAYERYRQEVAARQRKRRLEMIRLLKAVGARD